jgi:hypothetical protein
MKEKSCSWKSYRRLTNQREAFKNDDICTSECISSMSFQDRENICSLYWPQQTCAEHPFCLSKFHPAPKWAINCFFDWFLGSQGKYISSLEQSTKVHIFHFCSLVFRKQRFNLSEISKFCQNRWKLFPNRDKNHFWWPIRIKRVLNENFSSIWLDL